jgi:hypothetical protein
MTSDSGSEAKIPENPLLSKLTREGAVDSMTFWGYVGPSREEGVVTLYPSLENLSDSIEIARADILHVEDVPETVLLFGAKVVWVRREAKITRRQVDTAETVGTLGTAEAVRAVAPKDNVVEVRKGRLRMRMRTQGARSDCHSPCATCRDCSSVCICTCRYTDPVL